jgi:hypothetical protein
MRLKIHNSHFIDEQGRTVLLRGVNLGGNCKYPAKPYGATQIKTDFLDHRDVSYVGHPFPLSEAETHFMRLKHWGFNALRFLISWEGLEHKGPKQYDQEYLDYIEEILTIATTYGFYTIIDCHQDVWSRMSGGSGAPGWTFEKVGLDFTKFDACEAAYVMQYRYDPNNPQVYPPMYWSANSIRFASATMWTLFFGGRDFAPSSRIDGINVQDYLQSHLIDAIKQVASRVKDNPNVLGFDSLNEPQLGWIELMADGSNNKNLNETLGYAFTPLDAMATAAGYPRIVGYREVRRFGIKETRKDELNSKRASCWLPGRDDIWQKEGVWRVSPEGNPTIVRNDYFVVRGGKPVDFMRDYLSPFITRFAQEVRSIMPDAMIFCEGPSERVLKGEKPNFDLPSALQNMVFAPHWYDVATLGTKRPMLLASFDMMTNRPVVTPGSVAEMFVRHLGVIQDMGKNVHGGIPTVLAEFGLPYDLKNKEAFEKVKTEGEKAWETHVKCLSLYYDAVDANLLHSLQWNYTATNTNQWGDGWNLEDLSIFSRDQQSNPSDPNSGGRAILGFCRPHYVYCTGTPVRMAFDYEKGAFAFEFEGNPALQAPTVIYVPRIHYPKGYTVKLSEGSYEINENEQLLLIRSTMAGKHSVIITKRK